MTLTQLLKLAKAYDKLGWAVQEQLESLNANGEVTTQNPNALRMIDRDFLKLAQLIGNDDPDLLEGVKYARAAIAEATGGQS